MNQKQRIFIYDRKEMAVLLLLGVMVAVFAFTLGVHLGKRVGVKNGAQPGETSMVATNPDKTPDSKELADQTKNAGQAADETLNQSLHDEVDRTGIKLDNSKQVDLPRNTKSANGGATTLNQTAPVAHPAPKNAAAANSAATEEATENAEEEKPARTKLQTTEAVAPQHKGPVHYTLQVGSYPVLKEARARADDIRGQGLNPTVQEAEIQGKGRWYRIYIGEFPTKFEAEKAGQHYQAERLIDSFVVAKLTGPVTQ